MRAVSKISSPVSPPGRARRLVPRAERLARRARSAIPPSADRAVPRVRMAVDEPRHRRLAWQRRAIREIFFLA